jgi:hypothetical protein
MHTQSILVSKIVPLAILVPAYYTDLLNVRDTESLNQTILEERARAQSFLSELATKNLESPLHLRSQSVQVRLKSEPHQPLSQRVLAVDSVRRRARVREGQDT